MGCDVHGFLEKKHKGKWCMLREIERSAYDGDSSSNFRNRDYNYFSALAGVRGEGPEPKDLPTDVSDSVQMHSDNWDTDGHSHSYMPISEAIALHKFLYPDNTKYGRAYHLFGLEKHEVKDISEYRVVFWFDN